MNIITTRQYPEDYLKNILHTLESWTAYISHNINFTFVKFGDGEFYCMMGMQGSNCDHHLYSRELGDMLLEAWRYFSTSTNKYIHIAEWGDQPGSFGIPQNVVPQKNKNNPVFQFQEQLLNQIEIRNLHLVNFEILLQNTLSEQKYNFFKCIKESKRNKVFVGPERLSKVTAFLNADSHIQTPLINSFTKYDAILDNCKQRAKDNSIFIFSCGMPAKSIISDLLKHKSDITCLDTGSSFDAVFVGGTREGQLDLSVVKNYYKDLL